MAFNTNLLFAFVALLFVSSAQAVGTKSGFWDALLPQNLGFSWSNCGPGSDPLQIKSITVSPDPIAIPGNVTVGTSFTITSALPTDIRVSVTMEKKVGSFYIKVPCIDNLGSCNYGNICESWAELCPKYLAPYGIPCTCPIPPNTYSIPTATFDVTAKLPSQANGDFRITADMSSGSGHLGCLRIEVNLKS